MVKEGRRRLTNAMADLSRKLRRQISADEHAHILQSVGMEYRAAFTTRPLLRDDEGRRRFGGTF
jgi:hypothetical protein